MSRMSNWVDFKGKKRNKCEEEKVTGEREKKKKKK